MPWSQVADAMQPNFALTGDQAAQTGASGNGADQRASIEAPLAQAWGLERPTSSRPCRRQQLPPPKRARTISRQPASRRRAPPPRTAQRTSTATPVSSTELGLDPILRYQTGLALFENRADAQPRGPEARRCCSNAVPFVARLKVAVLPYRPNLAYFRLHLPRCIFSPNRRCGSGSTPARSPATGATPQNGADQCVRRKGKPARRGTRRRPARRRSFPYWRLTISSARLSPALSTFAQQIGNRVGGGEPRGRCERGGQTTQNRAVTAISGQDLNSRLTVARQSDNTLYVRIGATDQATAGAAPGGADLRYRGAFISSAGSISTIRIRKGRKVDPQIRIVTHTQFS